MSAGSLLVLDVATALATVRQAEASLRRYLEEGVPDADLERAERLFLAASYRAHNGARAVARARARIERERSSS